MADLPIINPLVLQEPQNPTPQPTVIATLAAIPVPLLSFGQHVGILYRTPTDFAIHT